MCLFDFCSLLVNVRKLLVRVPIKAHRRTLWKKCSHGVSSGFSVPAVGFAGAALLPVVQLQCDSRTTDRGARTLLLGFRFRAIRGILDVQQLVTELQLPPALRWRAAAGGNFELIRGEYINNCELLTWLGLT